MSIKHFYEQLGITTFTEGHCGDCPCQQMILKALCTGGAVKNVMEIGFNAGHSADLFLSSNEIIEMVSFDIGHYDYVNTGKEYIDKTYPDRHTLILGDSLNTVPQHNKKYDLIFIDGCHKFNNVRNDILNCRKLAHPETIVIIDDTITNGDWIKNYNIGPNLAWKGAVEWNIVKHHASVDFRPGRGMSWGKYCL